MLLTRIIRLFVVAATVAVIAGCATGQAVKSAKEAADKGDWDSAVAYYRQALNSDPSRIDIKLALERAMRNASTDHLKRARAFEQQDQLSGAAAEYRLAADLDPGNTLAITKALELERKIRDQIEASRPRARIDDLRQQAAQASPIPRLDPRVKVTVNFNGSVKDLLNVIGASTGINITYDSIIPTINQPYQVNVTDVSLEDVLNQIMTANTLTYKVNGPKSIFIYADSQANRLKYEDQFVQTFYLSNSDPSEIVQIVTQILGTQGPAIRPIIYPNKTANAVQVKATAPVMQIIAGIIQANDKPRAEVMIDVEILEVDRQRAKDLGLELSNYALGFSFSPEVAPPNTSGSFPPGVPPPFNLNTISNGVSPADFYMTVPSAQIHLLESDAKTKLLAKPQVRGRENAQITLNLGDEIPVATTTFLPLATGGAATQPQVSYTYRQVGVNLNITPRVTYQDEIILQLMVERSGVGQNVNVAGTLLPSFVARRAQTELRLRDGESNLLAGLLKEDDANSLQSFPGIMEIPLLRSLFGHTQSTAQTTDIVMIVTPHIVRSHELTAADLKPMYVGTGQNFGAGSVPTLISPDAPPPPQPAPTPQIGAPQGAGRGAGAGTQPPTPTPTPTPTPPPVGQAVTPPPATPPAGATGRGGEAPPRPAGVVPLEAVNPAPTAPPQAPPAQVVVTAPTTPLAVGGVPATVPIMLTGVSQLSTVSVTVTYDPKVVRAVSISEGSFMRQGGNTPTFTQKIDAALGRVDIAVSRPNDESGASGTGLLAGIVFQAVAPGTSQVAATAVTLNVKGAPTPVTVVPATLTVK